MDPFALCRHLAGAHRQPDAVSYHLDADSANRLHARLHGGPADHLHLWLGRIADPQGPIKERR